MKFLICLAVFIGFLPVTGQGKAHAQYYNSTGSSGSGTLYNAPSGSSGPLNLRAYARGNTSSATGSTGYTYKGKPYGVDTSSYSLALSPQQVQENQKRRARDRAERERQRKMAQTENDDRYDVEEKTQDYLRQFQNDKTLNKRNSQAGKKRVLYKKNKDIFNAPRRVFNSPY